MKLSLYNTLTKKIEEFEPIYSDKKNHEVGLYTCGPTVYNRAHIGNLRTYIFEDILKRALIFNNFKVKHVMNITDVGHLVSDDDMGDDKMELGAQREGLDIWALSQKYTDLFQKDIQSLNILEPNIWCKATDHIPEQIQLVQELEARGLTYIIEDGVYLDTSQVKNYGKLTGQDLTKIQAGARVEMSKGKKHATDFAIWKFSPKDKTRLMEWDSPWGKGFPGWHLECSAMSMKYLGNSFDIHCGGIDHVPIHHTNEIAQTESITGKDWVKYWIHGEFLVEVTKDNKEGKMSKSKGDFLSLTLLKDKGYDPLVYRYFCLNAHYKAQLKFTFEALESAKNGFQNLKNQIIQLKKECADQYSDLETIRNNRPHKDIFSPTAQNVFTEFQNAINNNLNTPQAFAQTWLLLKTDLSPIEKLKLLYTFDHILGLSFDMMEEKKHTLSLDQSIQNMIEERNKARKNKDFQKADQIRTQLDQMSIILKDTPAGTTWHKK